LEPSWVKSERIDTLFAIVLTVFRIKRPIWGSWIAVDWDKIPGTIIQVWKRVDLVTRSKPIIGDREPFVVK
jgi:hypothetical protein